MHRVDESEEEGVLHDYLQLVDGEFNRRKSVFILNACSQFLLPSFSNNIRKYFSAISTFAPTFKGNGWVFITHVKISPF